MQFIKKVFYFVIVTCVLFLLSSCNDQLSAKDVDSLISQIGEVSIDSRSQINETREMFELLSDDEKQNVTMIETLKNAEAQLYELTKESELESIKQRYGNNVGIYSNSVVISRQVASTASESFIGCYGTAYSFYLKNCLEQEGIDDININVNINVPLSFLSVDYDYSNGKAMFSGGASRNKLDDLTKIPAYEDFPLLADFGVLADCPENLMSELAYGENGATYSVSNLSTFCYELGDYLEICDKLGFYASDFFSVNDATFDLQLKHEIIDTTVYIQCKSDELIISWN